MITNKQIEELEESGDLEELYLAAMSRLRYAERKLKFYATMQNYEQPLLDNKPGWGASDVQKDCGETARSYFDEANKE